MNKLRIAMLTTFYPPYSFGGDAIGIQRLATAIAKRGHEVTVIHDIDAFKTLSDANPAPISHPENIQVIGLESKVGLLSNLLTHQLGQPIIHHKKLEKVLSPGNFDIIWFHNISLVGGPQLLSYGDGIKVYEAHEHWLVCPTHVLWRHNRELCDAKECIKCAFNYRRPPQLWRYSSMLEKQLDNVDLFIAKSQFSRDKHYEFGFSKEMSVIPYFLPEKISTGVDNNSSPHERPYFLFVGRLEKIKGLDEVIPIFSDYPQADLLILGSGDYEDELKKQAGNINNIRFLGRLDPEELSRYYKFAIALIVPSVCYETFGIILIESFREGTPVIAKKQGPFIEIVNQSKGGLLYSDQKELLQAMKTLQNDEDFRNDTAQAARSGFEKNWSEDVVVKHYFKSIRHAARNNNNEQVARILEQEI